TAPGIVLDVGCGDGRLLARMANSNWRTVGIDPDPEAIAAARGRVGSELHVGTIHDIPADRRFDAIVMFHVIEHVPDPLATLVRARELLRDGGVVSVVTPNAGSWLHRRYGGKWRGLEPPRHLQILSQPGLRTLVASAGFQHGRTFTTSRNAGALALASEISSGRYVPGIRRTGMLTKAELLHALEWLRLLVKPDCGEELVAIFSM
ncbi:MAG TPA: class I SAM-dependent methyltransferase, partial [Chloroflexota bacterium]|nr:class I SAM-dependent methyltransferase [Chloroflexota bacterium]